MKRSLLSCLVALGFLCSVGIVDSAHARRPHANGGTGGGGGGKYVVSWQHLKGECYGKPYQKISQQCQNRVNFWHGIYCRVTWSDGSTTDLHGKVDLVDGYGRAYCTRATRPANFNCVSQCDYTNGPFMTLPRP